MPSGQIIARTTNTWLVRLYQGRDPATGKRRYLSKTVHGERTSAEAELACLLSQIPARPESTSSLDVYLDWWLHAAVDGRLRAKSARDYRALLARYVRPELGNVKLSRLKPLDLQSLLLSLTSRGLSARTVRYTHAVLRSALDQARRWKLLAENPAADMPLPRADKREFRVLKPEEAQRFTSLLPPGSGGTRSSGGLDDGSAAQRVSRDSRRRLRSAPGNAYDHADARTS